MQVNELWRIDPERSTLRFSLRHALLGELGGQFGCWGGHVRLDGATPPTVAARIWVELSSIDTGSLKRDDQILRTELFDNAWEPALEFDGERLEIDASGRLKMSGWLGLRSRRTEVALDLAGAAMGVDVSGTPRFTCTATASISRRALGLRKNRGGGHWLDDQLLAENIDVVAHVEAVRVSAATAWSPAIRPVRAAFSPAPRPAADGLARAV
jgi:polyisoprenoid-binding protein YceI